MLVRGPGKLVFRVSAASSAARPITPEWAPVHVRHDGEFIVATRRTFRMYRETSIRFRRRICVLCRQVQTQHICILLEDIAETRNLRRPTCFADSSPDLHNVVTIRDVLAKVDQRLERENGRVDVLMLSGGEPTLHPQLPELLAELSARLITRILLNTNVIRIG
jgi:uncharacterized radical SAM superfamily Fe-S cluster-containing enzyme